MTRNKATLSFSAVKDRKEFSSMRIDRFPLRGV